MPGESGEKVWDKLDTIDRRGTDMLIEMSRMGGDQRTAHAEFNGKLNLLTSKMEAIDKQQAHDMENTSKALMTLGARIDNLEEKTNYFLGKVAGVSAIISLGIAAAGLAVKILGSS